MIYDKTLDAGGLSIEKQNLNKIITELHKGFETSIKPEKHMLLVPHENKPSMIAQVATVIGEHNININRMNVAQKSKQLSKSKDNISIMIIISSIMLQVKCGYSSNREPLRPQYRATLSANESHCRSF